MRPKLLLSSIYDIHYEDTPMKFTAIFHGCKNDNVQMKRKDIFLIFAQNINRGHTLVPNECP